ncbi:hypothetical protein BYT27DRAFT_7048387, partial [Phlegmacium glaucopus]
EDANVAIRSGLCIEGKKVWGRKQTQEPRRCLKCQCFGMHKATKCTSTHKGCGRCVKHHRTNECTELDQNMLEYANCRAAKLESYKGHGAADRRCPIFLARVIKTNLIHQENNYKFFCTMDPATW